MNWRKGIEHNVGNALAVSFFQVFLVFMPVAVPFFQSKGLDMQDVFVLQALFAAIVLVAEVPSGYVADLLGRRNAVLIGTLFTGIGFSLLLAADGFWTLLAFEAALAIAHSLVSGADLALIYDSEVALGRPESARTRVVSRHYGLRSASEALASLACSALVLIWSMHAVIWLQALVGWLPFLLCLRLVEPPRHKLDRESHAGNMKMILRHLWHSGSILRLSLLSICIWGLTTFYAVWLLQELWQRQQVPLVYFGLLWAVYMTVASASARIALWLEERIGAPTLLLLACSAPVLGYIGLAVFGVWGGLLAASSFFFARGVGLVLLSGALNSRVPSSFRATANSITSFGFRAGFALSGPLVGYYYDAWGMAVTLWLLAGLSSVVVLSLIVPLAISVAGHTEAANEVS